MRNQLLLRLFTSISPSFHLPAGVCAVCAQWVCVCVGGGGAACCFKPTPVQNHISVQLKQVKLSLNQNQDQTLMTGSSSCTFKRPHLCFYYKLYSTCHRKAIIYRNQNICILQRVTIKIRSLSRHYSMAVFLKFRELTLSNAALTFSVQKHQENVWNFLWKVGNYTDLSTSEGAFTPNAIPDSLSPRG